MEGMMKRRQLKLGLVGLSLLIGIAAASSFAEEGEPKAPNGSLRLNRTIQILERGGIACGSFEAFRDPDFAASVADRTAADFVLWDFEHRPYDITQLRMLLLGMFNRAEVYNGGKGRLQPRVTPLARIPDPGRNLNEGIVKQILDVGLYGWMLPMVETGDEARRAVQVSRYGQCRGVPDEEPQGLRGAAGVPAIRYWGLKPGNCQTRDPNSYQMKADVWPLDPNGDLLFIAMIETLKGVENAEAIFAQHPIVFIGPFDLSWSLGRGGEQSDEVCPGCFSREEEELIAKVVAVKNRLQQEGKQAHIGIFTSGTNCRFRASQGFDLLFMPYDPAIFKACGCTAAQ